MESFETEFDIGTYGKDDYNVIPCTVEYSISAYVPERAYLSNGDPGYPAEGGELEEMEVYDVKGVNITKEVPVKWLNKFEEMCYEKHDKYQ